MDNAGETDRSGDDDDDQWRPPIAVGRLSVVVGPEVSRPARRGSIPCAQRWMPGRDGAKLPGLAVTRPPRRLELNGATVVTRTVTRVVTRVVTPAVTNAPDHVGTAHRIGAGALQFDRRPAVDRADGARRRCTHVGNRSARGIPIPGRFRMYTTRSVPTRCYRPHDSRRSGARRLARRHAAGWHPVRRRQRIPLGQTAVGSKRTGRLRIHDRTGRGGIPGSGDQWA